MHSHGESIFDISQQSYKHECSDNHFLAPHHIVQYLQVYAGTAGHLVDIWQWTSATSDVNVRLRKMNVLMLLVTLRCSICLLFYNTQTNYKHCNSVKQKSLLLRVIWKWTVQSHTKKKFKKSFPEPTFVTKIQVCIDNNNWYCSHKWHMTFQ